MPATAQFDIIDSPDNQCKAIVFPKNGVIVLFDSEFEAHVRSRTWYWDDRQKLVFTLGRDTHSSSYTRTNLAKFLYQIKNGPYHGKIQCTSICDYRLKNIFTAWRKN